MKALVLRLKFFLLGLCLDLGSRIESKMQDWGLGRWPGASIQTDLCVERESGSEMRDVTGLYRSRAGVAASGGT